MVSSILNGITSAEMLQLYASVDATRPKILASRKTKYIIATSTRKGLLVDDPKN